MATTASSYRTYPYTRDQAFFLRMALIISGIVVVGFVQWAARGFVVPATTPIWVHIHGAAMLAWLALFVTQNALVARGNLALHRRLGWASLGLVAFIVFIGMFTGEKAIALHRVPPFFTNAYFLALTHVEVLVFAATFGAAVALRRQTQWHRRLMLAATVILMEPGLGRMLPLPLLGPVIGPWAEAVLQLAVLGFVARHDRNTLGRVHPATTLGAGLVFGTHLAVMLLSGFAPVIAVAEGLAAG